NLEGIAEEARHFRIEPCVFGDREQVATHESDAELAEIPQADRAERGTRERVVDRQLLQLGVRSTLDKEVVGIEPVVETDPVVRERLLRARRHWIRDDAARRSVRGLAELILHPITGRLECPLPRAVVQ